MRHGEQLRQSKSCALTFLSLWAGAFQVYWIARQNCRHTWQFFSFSSPLGVLEHSSFGIYRFKADHFLSMHCVPCVLCPRLRVLRVNSIWHDWPENIFGPRTYCDWPMICFHLQKYETLAMYVLTTDMISHHSMTLPEGVQKGLSWHGEAQRSKSGRADRVPELPPSAKTAEGISSSLWGASRAIEQSLAENSWRVQVSCWFVSLFWTCF